MLSLIENASGLNFDFCCIQIVACLSMQTLTDIVLIPCGTPSPPIVPKVGRPQAYNKIVATNIPKSCNGWWYLHSWAAIDM